MRSHLCGAIAIAAVIATPTMAETTTPNSSTMSTPGPGAGRGAPTLSHDGSASLTTPKAPSASDSPGAARTLVGYDTQRGDWQRYGRRNDGHRRHQSGKRKVGSAKIVDRGFPLDDPALSARLRRHAGFCRALCFLAKTQPVRHALSARVTAARLSGSCAGCRTTFVPSKVRAHQNACTASGASCRRRMRRQLKSLITTGNPERPQ